MVIVDYCKNGLCLSDFEAEEWVRNMLSCVHETDNIKFEVGTDFMLGCFTLEVIEHRFPADQIKFFVKGKEIKFNADIGLDDGELEPYGFPLLADRILRAGYENIKARRNNP